MGIIKVYVSIFDVQLLNFSYELGGGPSELVTTHKVNDGNKHTVKLIR